jgi:DNA-binding MarR family transcriptional regulator
MTVIKGDYLMSEKIEKEQIKQFASNLQEMNRVYENYAKSFNLSYTNLQILNLLTEIKDCTQKQICEATFLPKQTVNTIITNFYKQGLIELIEMPDNRRVKTLHFTKRGKVYMENIIPKIRKAEILAMNSLTPEQRTIMLESMQKYCNEFSKLNEEMN